MANKVKSSAFAPEGEEGIHQTLVSMPERAVPVPSGKRVLYVERDPDVARINGRLLEELGYSVTMHGDGDAALSDFLSRPDFFSSLIAGIDLPGLNGEALAREVLRVRPDFPLLLTSPFDETMACVRTIDTPSGDLIIKPVSAKLLAVVLERAIEKQESVKRKESSES